MVACWTSAAPGLLVRHRTTAARSGHSRKGRTPLVLRNTGSHRDGVGLVALEGFAGIHLGRGADIAAALGVEQHDRMGRHAADMGDGLGKASASAPTAAWCANWGLRRRRPGPRRGRRHGGWEGEIGLGETSRTRLPESAPGAGPAPRRAWSLKPTSRDRACARTSINWNYLPIDTAAPVSRRRHRRAPRGRAT